MKIIKNIVPILMFVLFFLGCSQQKARKPISQTSGTFLKESAERNKKLIASEESKIDSIIKSNPDSNYISSKKGYWYIYESKNDQDTLRPKKGDVAYFNYEIKDLRGNIIYSELELKPQEYHVDKEQKIIIGLRHGIKLMHKKEKITFLFPSHVAYGYHGDEKRIGANQPIICTLTLNDFKPEISKPKEIKKETNEKEN
ncbi:MAG: gliding motility-associated peptidyl-prolyl isomerase GldI [Flavobacterium sp.]|jgi:gliding motility-associated peptidyl-prolyl isomerase|nr:gliding motility-associated peptidyl-prolyl isomerase GldI [Flavobacterium sp.]